MVPVNLSSHFNGCTLGDTDSLMVIFPSTLPPGTTREGVLDGIVDTAFQAAEDCSRLFPAPNKFEARVYLLSFML
jgi:hypothetical protein